MSGVREESIKFIKENKRKLLERFASSSIFQAKSKPSSLFMAGSPGAGKTEYSKNLIKRLDYPLVRIDADDIRDFIPYYKGDNSDEVQGAAALGVEKLYDEVLKKKYDMILDGTFANFDIALRDVKRSIDKNREVGIFYIYQDPDIAWGFVKKREKLEGRKVPKEMFIESFFNSRNTVDKIKLEFGNKVRVYVIKKDYLNKVEKSWFNVGGSIDNYLKIDYTPEMLYNKLVDNI